MVDSTTLRALLMTLDISASALVRARDAYSTALAAPLSRAGTMLVREPRPSIVPSVSGKSRPQACKLVN